MEEVDVRREAWYGERRLDDVWNGLEGEDGAEMVGEDVSMSEERRRRIVRIVSQGVRLARSLHFADSVIVKPSERGEREDRVPEGYMGPAWLCWWRMRCVLRCRHALRLAVGGRAAVLLPILARGTFSPPRGSLACANRDTPKKPVCGSLVLWRVRMAIYTAFPTDMKLSARTRSLFRAVVESGSLTPTPARLR